jgi:hypothetical protein
MERSSRFLSLSGLSGVFIGFYALAGSLAAAWYVNSYNYKLTSYYYPALAAEETTSPSFLSFYVVDALVVLALSLLTGYVFTHQLAKKQGFIRWDASARRMVINLLIPLVTGGIFCLILAHHDQPGLVAPSMLVFYGLSLLNASKYTHGELRTLGILEIILGLIAALHQGYGLFCWALGFGVLHIIYGITMYYKYER